MDRFLGTTSNIRGNTWGEISAIRKQLLQTGNFDLFLSFGVLSDQAMGVGEVILQAMIIEKFLSVPDEAPSKGALHLAVDELAKCSAQVGAIVEFLGRFTNDPSRPLIFTEKAVKVRDAGAEGKAFIDNRIATLKKRIG